MSTTGWFPANVKPAREGVYERKYRASTAYSRWDGVRWLAGRYECELAASEFTVSRCQALPWRGLNFNPKATA